MASDVSTRALEGRYLALSEELAGHILRSESFEAMSSGDLSGVRANDVERWFASESKWLSTRFASLAADIAEVDRLHDAGKMHDDEFERAGGILEEVTERTHADAQLAVEAARAADAEFGTEWAAQISGLFTRAPEARPSQAAPSTDMIREAEEAQAAREEAAEREREAIESLPPHMRHRAYDLGFGE